MFLLAVDVVLVLAVVAVAVAGAVAVDVTGEFHGRFLFYSTF